MILCQRRIRIVLACRRGRFLPAAEIHYAGIHAPEEGVEEDPRAELVEKLLEYKLFKYMSYELKDRQIDAERAFYKEPTVPKEVAAYRPPVNLEELIGDLTLHRLNQIIQDVLKRQEEKIAPLRSKFGKIEIVEVSMSEKLVQVRSYFKEHKQFSFRQMLSKNSSKVSVIVTFLVILELIKTGKTECCRNAPYGRSNSFLLFFYDCEVASAW